MLFMKIRHQTGWNHDFFNNRLFESPPPPQLLEPVSLPSVGQCSFIPDFLNYMFMYASSKAHFSFTWTKQKYEEPVTSPPPPPFHLI